MREAARTAGQIAVGRRGARADRRPAGGAAGLLPDRASRRWRRPGADKVELLRRADTAARAFDPRIVRVEASMSEEWREVLVVTSDGRLGPRPAADDPLRRARGGRGGRASARAAARAAPPGGAWSSSSVPDQSPEEHGREAARLAVGHAARGRGAGRADGGGAGPGRVGHPAARGGGPRPGGRLQPQEDLELHRSARQAGGLARCARWSTTAPWATPAARSTSTTRATPAQRNVLIENGILVGYMQDRMSAKHFGADAVGQRPARELPPRAAAAHDQHLHDGRAGRPRGHHPVGQARRVRQDASRAGR